MNDKLDSLEQTSSLDDLLKEIDQLSSLSASETGDIPVSGRHFATTAVAEKPLSSPGDTVVREKEKALRVHIKSSNGIHSFPKIRNELKGSFSSFFIRHGRDVSERLVKRNICMISACRGDHLAVPSNGISFWIDAVADRCRYSVNGDIA